MGLTLASRSHWGTVAVRTLGSGALVGVVDVISMEDGRGLSRRPGSGSRARILRNTASRAMHRPRDGPSCTNAFDLSRLLQAPATSVGLTPLDAEVGLVG